MIILLEYFANFNLCFVNRSELFLENHKLQVDVNENVSSVVPSTLSYSLPILEEMMGLKLCTNYRIPNITEIIKSPMVIFNGPLNLNIFLLKSDVKVNKYVIEYKWLTSKVSVHVITFYFKVKTLIFFFFFRKTLPSALCMRPPGQKLNII